MDCIELMVEEHKNIKRMLVITRKLCYMIIKQENVDYNDFYKVIDFVKNYADKHHHGKEEAMLFNRMTDELGPAAQKLVTYGMLVEHDLGRLYMRELEAAVAKVIAGVDEAKVDVIGSAMSYASLLTRHIEKEDNVVYKFAKNGLSKETMASIQKECDIFESEGSSEAAREKYIALVAEMEVRLL